MSTLLRRIFTPPYFPDNEEKTRAASLLNSIVLATMVALIAYSILGPIPKGELASHWIIVGPVLPVLAAILFIMHRNHVWMASIIFLIVFYMMLSAAAYLDGGVSSPGYNGMVILVIMAGLLLGRRAAFSAAGICILTGALFLYAEQIGISPTASGTPSSLSLWASQTGYLVVAAVLLSLARGVTKRTFDRAYQELTERRRTEERLRVSEEQALHQMERLKTFREIDKAILAVKSPEAIAKAAVQRIQDLIRCDHAHVVVFDHHAKVVKVLASNEDTAAQIKSGLVVDFDHYGIDQQLEQGKAAVIDDLLELSELTFYQGALLADGLRSLICFPMADKETLIGALYVGSRKPGNIDMSVETIEIARELADLLAIAIQQVSLQEQIQLSSQGLEQLVAERTAQLEAKARELETFAYSVAHDLKAPLRGINGYSHLLLEEQGDRLEGEGREFIHSIRQATHKMSDLIDDLLAYARLERKHIHKSRIFLPNLIQIVVSERLREIRQQNINISVDIPIEYVHAEYDGLGQALRNLLDNAIKFTRLANNPCIEIGGRETNGSAIIWVKDNGIGFNSQYQDRIFELFQRLNKTEDYPGTGIGLALVRKAMQQINGKVWAESYPDSGATFYLEIPR